MAVAKRSGPDFLFLANKHSQKFDDLAKSSRTNLYFQNSSTQDWVSITGNTVTSDSTDPRIKESQFLAYNLVLRHQAQLASSSETLHYMLTVE